MIFLIIGTIHLQAQYAVVVNRTVLPELVSSDIFFQNQLDSILFVKYPCGFSYNEEKRYAYFIRVNETEFEHYTISVIYLRPSSVENDYNTGLYLYNNFYIIVREDSHNPLFKATGEKIIFNYEKELMKRNRDNSSFYYDEINNPEEFCSWYLSYSKHKLQLKILDMTNVEGIDNWYKLKNTNKNSVDYRDNILPIKVR